MKRSDEFDIRQQPWSGTWLILATLEPISGEIP